MAIYDDPPSKDALVPGAQSSSSKLSISVNCNETETIGRRKDDETDKTEVGKNYGLVGNGLRRAALRHSSSDFPQKSSSILRNSNRSTNKCDEPVAVHFDGMRGSKENEKKFRTVFRW